MLTKELFNQIVDLLSPEMGDAKDRKALIEGALYGNPVLQKIKWEGAARQFTVQLVRLLSIRHPGGMGAISRGLRP